MPIEEIVALALLWLASFSPVHDTPVEHSRVSEAQVFHAAFDVSGSVEWAEQAVAVTFCESGWSTTAVGRANEWGLAQIHPVHALPRVRGVHAQLRQAYMIWSRTENWTAWSCRP